MESSRDHKLNVHVFIFSILLQPSFYMYAALYFMFMLVLGGSGHPEQRLLILVTGYVFGR